MSKYLFIVILLSLLPLMALLPDGLPITHDGADHVARIANFYQALEEGIAIPRWAENLNWGYGHPILMFLYPFSSYTASLFHLLGFSYIDSLKIIFALGFVASGVTMFMWLSEQFDEQVATLGSLFYIFAPYRFVDLYVRGAIGEHMAFIFPPLILFFLLKFFRSESLWYRYLHFSGVSISFAFLLLAHNAISLMFLPFIAVYILYLSYVTKKIKEAFIGFIAIAVGLFISGFFTFPAFFEGKYTLRDIVTGNDYRTRFIDNPLKFIYGPWNYGITGQFSVQLGIVQLIGLLCFPIAFIRKRIKKDLKILLVLISAFFILSLFIQLPISNFLYEIVTTLKKFQFPWRFLSLSTFTLAVIAACALFMVNKKWKTHFILSAIILLLLTTFQFWQAKGYFIKHDSNYQNIYHGTTDTGESAPIWSVRFMEKVPLASAEIISGRGKIDIKERTSTQHSYIINAITPNTRIRENTVYFPGWNVFIDGKKTEIQFQDPSERGLLTFFVPQGSHQVDVVFSDTKLRSLSNIMSIASLLLLIGLGIGIRIIKKSK